MLGRWGKRLTLLRCPGQESSLAFLSAFIFLYLSVLPEACSFSPSQNWVLTQQPVFLESQCVNCLGNSLSWEILETCSWSGFRQALGSTAGHIWGWRPTEFRSINRKFQARGKTHDLTQYCITEGYDGNTPSVPRLPAACTFLRSTQGLEFWI